MGPQAGSGPESLTTEDNCQAPSIHCLLQYWGELRASVWCLVSLFVCLFVCLFGGFWLCTAELFSSSGNVILSHRDIQPAEGERWGEGRDTRMVSQVWWHLALILCSRGRGGHMSEVQAYIVRPYISKNQKKSQTIWWDLEEYLEIATDLSHG
jgi:hypothetical protein|uniref:Uncharacterized protein n=1 Tax=Mus musculus TaxID=10090 RepID=Q8CAV5_MOUSE|nr:unnamed protein product [Mus musculus]